MKLNMVKGIAAILMAAVTLTSNPFGMISSEKVIAAEKKEKKSKKIEKKNVEKVKLNKTSWTLKKGQKVKLKVKNLSKKAKVKWISGSKAIVSVNKGNIKAKKVGKTKVTAIVTEKGKKTLKLVCKITVKESKKRVEKKKVTSMIVSTEAELKEALKNSDLEELKIKSDTEPTFMIPKGDYEKVKLYVETPKADITNYGKFAVICIHEIKKDTWYERAEGNKIEVKAKEARIVVSSESLLRDILLSEGSENVKIEVEGRLVNLSMDSETKLDVNVKGKLEVLNLVKKAEVMLASEGTIAKVNVQTESKIEIKGKSEKIEIAVQKEAKGSVIKTEIPIDLKTAAEVSVVLDKGAEGSKLESLEKEVEIKVENKTEEKIGVKTQEGTKQIENSNMIEEILNGLSNFGTPSPRIPLRDRGPLMGAYYRTWHDVASTGDDGAPHGGLNRMSEIPAEVDLAFVFTDWTAKESNFWNVLRNSYVPKLRAQGTRVIRTIGVRDLTSERGILKDTQKTLIHPDQMSAEEVQAKYAEYAKIIFDEYVNKHNLDGLDIDLEQHDEPNNGAKQHGKESPEIEEKKFLQAIGIIKELKKITGNDGHGIGKLLILDTTIPAGMSRIFQETATLWDYILVQKYGQHLAGVESNQTEDYGQLNWKDFGRYGVKPEHFMYGFSFYEEDGDKNNNVWADTVSLNGTGEKVENTQPLDPRNRHNGVGPDPYKWHLATRELETRNPGTPEDSNAYRHAKWQPKEGMKAGIFSYAVDRDGVEEGIDATKEKCGRRNKDNPLSISEQSDYFGKWGNNTKHIHTEYAWTKALKKIMVEDADYQPITEADIPDSTLRNIIINQIGKNWKGNLRKFRGELVIDNPQVTSLKGLNQMEGLRKLTLRNLPNIKEIRVDMLPLSLRPDYQGAPYDRVEETLVLENLSALEKLELTGFELEHLPIKNAETFVSLKNFDISENKIDFSEETKDLKTLKTLYDIVKGKDGQSFKFDLQKPQGYMPKVYKVDKIEDPNPDEKIFVGNLFAFGVGTANEVVLTEEKFDEYKAKTVLEPATTFIDPNYTWDEFKSFKNVDNQFDSVSFDKELGKNQILILDHTSSDVTTAQKDGISRKTQETYFLTYRKYYAKMKHYDEKGNFTGESQGYRKLHDCKIIVGEELERLANHALGAVVIGMSFKDNNMQGIFPSRAVKRLFDGKTLENKDDAIMHYAWNPTLQWLVFDIKKKATVTSWYVNNSFLNPATAAATPTVKKAELQYFEGDGAPTEEDMADSSKWKKADGFVEDSEIGEYSKNLTDSISARYWRYQLDDYGALLCLSEIQLKGKAE